MTEGEGVSFGSKLRDVIYEWSLWGFLALGDFFQPFWQHCLIVRMRLNIDEIGFFRQHGIFQNKIS